MWGAGHFDDSQLKEPVAVNPFTLYGYRERQSFEGLDLREVKPTSAAPTRGAPAKKASEARTRQPQGRRRVSQSFKRALFADAASELENG